MVYSCFLSSVATDGKDGKGLKPEKIGQFFQVLEVNKIAENFSGFALRAKIELISFLSLTGIDRRHF